MLFTLFLKGHNSKGHHLNIMDIISKCTWKIQIYSMTLSSPLSIVVASKIYLFKSSCKLYNSFWLRKNMVIFSPNTVLFSLIIFKDDLISFSSVVFFSLYEVSIEFFQQLIKTMQPLIHFYYLQCLQVIINFNIFGWRLNYYILEQDLILLFSIV